MKFPQNQKNEHFTISKIASPLGNMFAVASLKGIVYLGFSENQLYTKQEVLLTDEFLPILNVIESQLGEYFDGNRKMFDVALNPLGTPFQLKVWKELLNIPFGKTCSYKQQTQVLGNSNAIRAVASANGKNPIAILLPCHRIIGSRGSLTGYSGGLWRKQWLLEHEQRYAGQTGQLTLGNFYLDFLRK